MSGGVRGTVPWMAPELLSCKSLVTEKVIVHCYLVYVQVILLSDHPNDLCRWLVILFVG